MALQILQRCGVLLAALLPLAMLAGLPPEAEIQKSLSPGTLQNNASLLLDRTSEDAALEGTVRRFGDSSQPLTATIRVKGKSGPFGFNSTDSDDFDLSKTVQTLTFGAERANARAIAIQASRDTAHKLERWFEVVANGNQGGGTLDARLARTLFKDVKLTVGLNVTGPFRVMEGDKGTITYPMSFPVPHSADARYPIMSRPRTSNVGLGDRTTTMADLQVRNGTVTISADGGITTAKLQSATDTGSGPEEEFLIVIGIDGHASTNTNFRTVNIFTLGSGRKKVAVRIVNKDEPQPNQQHLAYLHGTVLGGLAGKTREEFVEDSSAKLAVMPLTAAPVSDVSIPFERTGFPAGEAPSKYDLIHALVTIKNGQRSSTIPLQIAGDSEDKRILELHSFEIDDTSGSWPTGYTKGDCCQFEVVMQGNNKLPTYQLSLNITALTKAADVRGATNQHNVVRWPNPSSAATPPFAGVGADDVVAGTSG